MFVCTALRRHDGGMEEIKRRPGARETARRLQVQAIVEAAERQLAANGAAGLSLRAIARELGMASSAVYRYFASAEELLTELILRAYSDLGDTAEKAAAAVAGDGGEAGFMAACHACRSWALKQPHRYALIYGSPVPDYSAPAATIEPAARVGLLLLGFIGEAAGGAPKGGLHAGTEPDAGQTMNPGMVQRAAGIGVPPSLLPAAIDTWTQLFGTISFELFGHYANVVEDRRSYFDHVMRDRCRGLLAAAGELSG